MNIKLMVFAFLCLNISLINANPDKKYTLQEKVRKFDESSFPKIGPILAFENSLLDKINLACRKCCLGEFKAPSDIDLCKKQFQNWDKGKDCGCE